MLTKQECVEPRSCNIYKLGYTLTSKKENEEISEQLESKVPVETGLMRFKVVSRMMEFLVLSLEFLRINLRFFTDSLPNNDLIFFSTSTFFILNLDIIQ